MRQCISLYGHSSLPCSHSSRDHSPVVRAACVILNTRSGVNVDYRAVLVSGTPAGSQIYGNSLRSLLPYCGKRYAFVSTDSVTQGKGQTPRALSQTPNGLALLQHRDARAQGGPASHIQHPPCSPALTPLTPSPGTAAFKRARHCSGANERGDTKTSCSARQPFRTNLSWGSTAREHEARV